jgi:precorrin-3B C17-methyltransferase
VALDLAQTGRDVAVVSSGDPGIFAMASAVLEALEGGDPEGRWPGVKVEIVPGISAAQGAAARIGAPLGHDFCVISLSDNLKPWGVIERRLRAAAHGDFVVALYNPVSRRRPWQLATAASILAEYRVETTPVVLGRQIDRSDETVDVIQLVDLANAAVDMRTVVIVGSSTTRSFVSANGQFWVYTPRTYPDPEGGGAESGEKL